MTSHVFSEMEQLEQEMSIDEEEQNEEKALALAKAINDRRVALAGYLKLIVFNVFDVPLAAPVFGHYVKVRIMCVVHGHVCIIYHIAGFVTRIFFMSGTNLQKKIMHYN